MSEFEITPIEYDKSVFPEIMIFQNCSKVCVA